MEPYLALFEPDPKAGGYVVTFPDFGYGVTQGETEEEAMEMAQDLLMLTIGDCIRESRRVTCAPVPPRLEVPSRSVTGPASRQSRSLQSISGVGLEESGICAPDRDTQDTHRTSVFSPASLPPGPDRSVICCARQASARRSAQRRLKLHAALGRRQETCHQAGMVASATNASTSGESSGRLDVRPDRGFKLKPVVTSTPDVVCSEDIFVRHWECARQRVCAAHPGFGQGARRGGPLEGPSRQGKPRTSLLRFEDDDRSQSEG